MLWIRAALIVIIAISAAQAQQTGAPYGNQAAMDEAADEIAPFQSSATEVEEDTPIALSGVIDRHDSGTGRNAVAPSFQFGYVSRSVPKLPTAVSPSTAYSAVSMSASLSIDRAWQRHELQVEYSGGGELTSGSQSGLSGAGSNPTAHEASVTYTTILPRSEIVLGNETVFSTQASFGDMQRFVFSGELLPTARSFMLVPTDTILSRDSSRLSNTVLAGGSYALSRLTTVSLSGSWSAVRFLNGGFINYDQFAGMGSIEHSVTARSTVGLVYARSIVHFHEGSGSLTTDFVGGGYGRRVREKFYLQIVAGPQMITSTTPGGAQRPYVAAWVAVQRVWRTTSLDLQLSRAASAGSGVLAGARTKSAAVSVRHAISRHWEGFGVTGLARDSQLATRGAYRGWYAAGQLTRRLPWNTGLALRYGIRRESQPCAGGACDSLTQRVLSVTVQWQPRPIRVR